MQQLIKIHPVTRQKTFIEIEPGSKLGDILRKEFGKQTINVAVQNLGKDVALDLEHKIAANDVVVAYPIVAGSNDLIRFAALTALTLYAAPAAATWAGASWGTAASMATVLGGSYLINTVLPPTMPDSVENKDPLYSISNGSNSAQVGNSLPVVIGQTRMLPPLGAKVWTERSGNEEVLCSILHWGFDPDRTNLTDIKVGDTDLAALNGTVEYSNATGKLAGELNVDTLNGGDLPGKYEFLSSQEQQDIEDGATPPAGPTSILTWTSESDTTKCSIHLDYQVGRVNSSGKYRDEEVYFEVKYRKEGTSNWSTLTVSDVDASFWGTHAESHTGTYDTNNEHDVTGIITDYNVPDAPNQTWLRIQDSSHEQKRTSVDFEFPSADTWDVKLLRMSEKTSKTRTRNLSCSRILFFNEYETQAETVGQLRTLIKVPASEAISGTIQKITGLVSRSSYNFAPNTSASWQFHSNPAWWFLHVALGWKGGTSKVLYGAGIPIEKINIVQIEKWANWCDANNLSINYIFNSKKSARELLEFIASVGRAKLDLKAGNLSVIYDQAEQPFSFSISKDNIIEGSVGTAYSANKLPDEFVASILDENDDFKLTDVTVENPESTTNITSSPQQLPGVTSVTQAKEELHLKFAEAIYRNSKLSLTCELPALLMSEGDVVNVENEVHLVNGTTSRLWKIVEIKVKDADKHLYDLSLVPETVNYYNAKNGEYVHTVPDYNANKPTISSSNLTETYDFAQSKIKCAIGFDALNAIRFTIQVWVDDILTHDVNVNAAAFRFTLEHAANVRWTITPFSLNGQDSGVSHSGSAKVLGVEGIDVVVPTVPKPVGAGAGTPEEPADLFIGKHARIYWRATKASLGNESFDLDNAYVDDVSGQLVTQFEVNVYNDDTDALVRTETVSALEYVYTYEKNVEDNSTPIRNFRFEVISIGPSNTFSDPAVIYCSNPAPPAPSALSITNGTESFSAKYVQPSDLDYAGTLVWVDDSPSFVPSGNQVGEGNCWARGTDIPFRFNSLQSATYYVKVAHFDVFDDEPSQLNISSSLTAVAHPVPDPQYVAPAKVTGVSVAQTSTINPDGTASAKVSVSWTNVSGDFTHYVISLNDIEFALDKNNEHEFLANPAEYFVVKVKAVNINVAGAWSNTITITTTGDSTPPSQISNTGLNVNGSFQSAFLNWNAPPENDYSHTEVHRSITNNFANATQIGTGYNSFSETGLATNTAYFYWFIAVDKSGNKAAKYPGAYTGKTITTEKIYNGDLGSAIISADQIIANAVQGQHIENAAITNAKISNAAISNAKIADGAITNAKIANATIDDAKIANLSADKLKAGSVVAGDVFIGTRTAALVSANSEDPLSQANLKSTQLNPGNILISGGTSLQDWRSGADTSKIDGGEIAANSVTTNQLTVGNRNVTFEGFDFTPDYHPNMLTWTAGTISYGGANDVLIEQAVLVGAVTWTGSPIYVYWAQGFSTLLTTTDKATAYGPAKLQVGIYNGGGNFVANFGRTIIHGDSIKTGSIKANHLSVTDLIITNSLQIGNQVVTTDTIADGSVSDIQIYETTTKDIPSSSNSGTPTVNIFVLSNGKKVLVSFSGSLQVYANYNRRGHSAYVQGSRVEVFWEYYRPATDDWAELTLPSFAYQQIVDYESNYMSIIALSMSTVIALPVGNTTIRVGAKAEWILPTSTGGGVTDTYAGRILSPKLSTITIKK